MIVTRDEAAKVLRRVMHVWPLATDWPSETWATWAEDLLPYDFESGMLGVRRIEAKAERFPPSLAELIAEIKRTPRIARALGLISPLEGNVLHYQAVGDEEKAEEARETVRRLRAEMAGER